MRLICRAAIALGLSVLLAAMTSLLALSTVSAATKKTQAQAVSWAEKKADEKAKVGSGQCVALIYEYYKYLGYAVVYGNATDFQNNSLPDKEWKRIKNSKGFVPEPGDIAVWAAFSELNQYYTLGQYGHVGIVRSGDASNFKSVEQHINGLYTEYCSRPTGYVTCWIRPKWKAEAADPAGGDNGTGGGKTDTGGGGTGGNTEEQESLSEGEQEKLDNPLTVKGRTLKVKRSYLRKTRSYKVSRVLDIKDAKGQVTYKKVKGSKKVTINKTSGKVTIKKKLKKGTYTIKVKIAADGGELYNAAEKTVAFKVKVK